MAFCVNSCPAQLLFGMSVLYSATAPVRHFGDASVGVYGRAFWDSLTVAG